MPVKYPFRIRIIDRAKKYAEQSLRNTHDYGGWKDESQTDRKRQRIMTGRFGQLWVYEFCKLNNIPSEHDNSSVYEADDFDIKIMGYSVDVKTTTVNGICCQVNPALKSKNIDYYCFLKTDKQYSFSEPLGLIEKGEYYKNAILIPNGAKFPGTSIENKYHSGSYILEDIACLIPFEEGLFSLCRPLQSIA